MYQLDYQSKYWPRHSFLADPHHLTISNSGQCLPPCFGCLRTFLLRRCSPIPHDLLQVSHGPQSPTLQFFGPSEMLKYVIYTSNSIVVNVLYVNVSILIDIMNLVRTQSHLMMTFSIPSCFSQSSFLKSFRQWGRKSWFAIFFVFVKNLLIIVIIRKDFFLGSLKLKKFNYISSTWFDLFDDLRDIYT